MDAVLHIQRRRKRNYPVPRPFLKWVGGKRQLLPFLTEMLPPRWGTYHEPFVGGGALFFARLPKRAILSDLNQELIDCYTAVRDCVGDVIQVLKKHRYLRDYYYKIREIDPLSLQLAERAARTIYLNRTGFNGLYRVNSGGLFNVPFGRYKNPMICDDANLEGCSAALKTVDIRCGSFESVVENARVGDLVYFDPPYIPLSNTAYFTAYEKTGFGMENQDRLAQVFDTLTERNVMAMLSNSDVPWIRDRYARHRIRGVEASRYVNSKGDKRGPVGEVIITNF